MSVLAALALAVPFAAASRDCAKVAPHKRQAMRRTVQLGYDDYFHGYPVLSIGIGLPGIGSLFEIGF